MASGRVLGGYGLTEPGAGSRCGRDPDHRAPRGRCRRRAPGSSTAASGSSRTPVRPARTSSPPGAARRDAGDPEISAFIVPADAAGFSIGRLEEKLGLHASATGELIFQGVRIPAANLLGERGDGFRTFLKILDGGRIIDRRPGRRSRPGGARRGRSPTPRRASSSGGRSAPSRASRSSIADMATEIEAARASWSGERPGSRTRAATTRWPRPRPSCSPRRSAHA